jgi:hypothetical protein
MQFLRHFSLLLTSQILSCRHIQTLHAVDISTNSETSEIGPSKPALHQAVTAL